jgi:hypothetical protein
MRRAANENNIMATISNNLLLTANAFAKCAPNVSTNLRQCGSVSLCNAQPLLSTDLDDVYTQDGEYRVMDHLLKADMEIKSCEAQQNGLYDFLAANRVNLSKKVVPMGRDSGLMKIAPFLNLKQYSPINNEWWLFTGGSNDGTTLTIDVTSAGNVPLDVRSFPSTDSGRGIVVYLNSTGDGGVVLRTAWQVVSATLDVDHIELELTSLNTNSNNAQVQAMQADSAQWPESGYLTRGGNNVDDYEEDCQEKPAYNTAKLVQSWIKTRRYSLCKSSAYDQWRQLMLTSNPLFRDYGDVKDVERNRQLAAEFQKSFVQDFFWGKPLPNQNVATYDQLADIESFDDIGHHLLGSAILGVDGGICVGKRAEPVGVYEQLAECDRVVDLLGDPLDLPALFHAFYDIIRIRSAKGDNNRQIDVFTDTVYAELINRAMIKYYSTRAADHNGDSILRINSDAGQFSVSKKAEFGFLYRSYPLHWPAGVVFNVLTHYAFDDELAVATVAGIPATARRIWVLDFTGIYPGIIASNRIVQETGDLKTLAAVRKEFSCVMKVHTRQQTLVSQTDTTVVECPAGNLILENISEEEPIWGGDNSDPDLRYPTTTTTTTTSREN